MKVGVISQARMGSSRLPGKVLKLINGIPLIKYHCDRVLQTGYDFVLATTISENDDRLVEFAQQNSIRHYRGSEDDVLERFYGCAVTYGFDVIVRVTSDCPLIDADIISRGVELFFAQRDANVFVSNVLERTYPRGFDFEIFSFKLLENAYQLSTEGPDREHVTPYIRRELIEKENFIHVCNDIDKSEYRLTVDTHEDYYLVNKLITEYSVETMTYKEIIEVLDKHSELARINYHIEQKKYGE